MTEKNAVSEYAKPKEYHAPEASAKPPCQSSTIEPRTDLVIAEDIQSVLGPHRHAGTIAHRCVCEQGHEDQCECGCGHTWTKFKDVK